MLAIATDYQGDEARAADLYSRAYNLEKLNPAGDFDSKPWYPGSNAAFLFKVQENYTHAAALYKEVLGLYREKLGDADKWTQITMSDYADVLYLTGDYPQMLEIRRKQVAPLAAAGELSPQLAAALYNLAEAYWANGLDKDAAQETMNALSMLRRFTGSDVNIKDMWRRAALRAGLGPSQAWKNQALRAQTWCALDDCLRFEPPKSDRLDEIVWETLKFKLERWVVDAGAPHGEIISQGGLKALQNQSELPDGNYLLTTQVDRSQAPPIQLAAWIALSPWDVSLYDFAEVYPANGDPARWYKMSALPSSIRRKLPTLAFAGMLSPDAGPGGGETLFAAMGTSTLQLPPGNYRIMVTAHDGLRVDLDGRRIIDSWTRRGDAQDAAMVQLDGRSHAFRVEYFNTWGSPKLWLRLEPQGPEALSAMGVAPTPTTFESEVQRLTRELEQTPGKASLFEDRGLMCMRYGHFREAADDFVAAMRLDPTDYYHSWHAANALFQAGDRNGYARCCEEIMQRWGEAGNTIARERLSRACALWPGVVDPRELKVMANLPIRPETSVNNRSWADLAMGIVALRGNDWKQAADFLMESLATDNGPCARQAQYYFLAVAHAHMGETEQANRFVDRARELEPEISSEPGLGDMGFNNWLEWILAKEARKEAEAVLHLPTTVPAATAVN